MVATERVVVDGAAGGADQRPVGRPATMAQWKVRRLFFRGANAKFHGFLEFPRFLSVFGGGIVSGLRVRARLVQGASQGLTPGLKRLCEACAGFATVLGLVALGV